MPLQINAMANATNYTWQVGNVVDVVQVGAGLDVLGQAGRGVKSGLRSSLSFGLQLVATQALEVKLLGVDRLCDSVFSGCNKKY